MSFNSVPTTPVKEILAYTIPDGKDPNMLHCRVPNHVVTRGGPDSVFTWMDMLGTDRFVWRPADSPYATLGVCLDIRRDGDENEQFCTHDGMAQMMLQIQGPEPDAKNDADALTFGAPQQPHQQHPYALPIAPAPFQLPPPSGANTPDSLFSEGDNVGDFSPASSPRPAPQVGPASAALPPPLILPGGNGTIAPRDIFSPHTFTGLALPPASPPQAFPQMPPHPVDERRNRRAREKRKMPWDDSEFEASDDDASGDDDSEFAGPSTSRGGRTRKTSSAGGSPRGEPKSPLPCKFPGCDFVQRNGRQVDLVRHEQTHYPARPKHKCPDCGHEVSRKDALRRHQEQSCKKPGVGGVKRTGRKKTRRSFN